MEDQQRDLRGKYVEYDCMYIELHNYNNCLLEPPGTSEYNTSVLRTLLRINTMTMHIAEYYGYMYGKISLFMVSSILIRLACYQYG